METLDKCFENVCELDLIFHMDKVGKNQNYMYDMFFHLKELLKHCMFCTGKYHWLLLQHVF